MMNIILSIVFKSLAGSTILQIIPALENGGVERTTIDITRAVVKASGRALVVSAGGCLLEELVQAGGEHINMMMQSKNPLVMALNVERLTRLILREGVDLLHARSRAPAWSALIAARLTGRPFVTTYHSKVHENRRLKVLYNSVMVRSDAIIANSIYTAARIRMVHAPKSSPIFTIPRGIDTRYFDPRSVTSIRVEKLRQNWKIENEESRTIFILPARLTRWKGQLLAIEAAATLYYTEARKNFKLLLIGDAQGRNDYLSELKKSIYQHKLMNHVYITGPCSDMPAAYMLADVVLAPSIEPEPFGRTTIEAQAMQKPVIASDSGGQRETVITPENAGGLDYATGLTVRPKDAIKLAAAMLNLIDLPPAAHIVMGKRGRANVLKKYSVEAMTQATLAIYARLSSHYHD